MKKLYNFLKDAGKGSALGVGRCLGKDNAMNGNNIIKNSVELAPQIMLLGSF